MDVTFVNGYSRVPDPPASIIPFISNLLLKISFSFPKFWLPMVFGTYAIDQYHTASVSLFIRYSRLKPVF